MTLVPTQDVADVCELSQVSSLERADLSVEISCLLVHVINQLFVLFFNISLIQFISQLHLLKALILLSKLTFVNICHSYSTSVKWSVTVSA